MDLFSATFQQQLLSQINMDVLAHFRRDSRRGETRCKDAHRGKLGGHEFRGSDPPGGGGLCLGNLVRIFGSIRPTAKCNHSICQWRSNSIAHIEKVPVFVYTVWASLQARRHCPCFWRRKHIQSDYNGFILSNISTATSLSDQYGYSRPLPARLEKGRDQVTRHADKDTGLHSLLLS